MSTYEAWIVDQRPLFSRLPGANGAYSENDVVDWLTYPWDGFLIQQKTTLDDLPRQLDPLLCDPEWLDYLAILSGWYGIWDRNWSIPIKRTLIDNSFKGVNIWGNKGSAAVLGFILNTFQIRHLIQLGQSFLVDYSAVGDRIGAISWDFDIILPSEYFNTDTEKLARWIKDHFAPCWCRGDIKFDDTKFRVFNAYMLEDGSLLSPGTNFAIQI